jgi:hypothetical protein
MMMHAAFRSALGSLALLLVSSTASAQVPCTVDGHSYMVLVKAAGLVGVNDYVNLVSVPPGGGSEVSTLVDTAASATRRRGTRASARRAASRASPTSASTSSAS